MTFFRICLTAISLVFRSSSPVVGFSHRYRERDRLLSSSPCGLFRLIFPPVCCGLVFLLAKVLQSWSRMLAGLVVGLLWWSVSLDAFSFSSLLLKDGGWFRGFESSDDSLSDWVFFIESECLIVGYVDVGLYCLGSKWVFRLALSPS